MKSEWKTTLLGDVITLKRGYDLPSKKRIPGDIPIFSSSGISGTNDKPMCTPPGVITGRYGTIGQVFFSTTPYWPLNTTLYVEDFKGNVPKFIYYFLKTIHWEQFSGKSAVPGVNRNDVHRLEVEWPSIKEQERIAAILSSLDDKIELNQEINENLEQQAQAIFQLWFTDKKETNGCLADICQYSKEKVAVSSLDLDSYYSTENMLPGKAGATQAANLPTTAQTTGCKIGDVLVSNIRPYFKKIVYCYSDCGCSTDVLCFTPKQKELSAYLYFALYTDSFFDFMVAGSKGTKMPRGDKQQIMTYPVCVPSGKELIKFNDVAQPILKQIQLHREENKSLILLRDTLLPKLMAGDFFTSDN